MIAAIVLAAGESKRFGQPKQLLLLDRVLENVREARLDDVIVVLGAHAAEVLRDVDLQGTRIVINENYGDGMSSSIQAGLRALHHGAEAAMIILGDQPYVRSGTMKLLVNEFRRVRPDALVPVHDGKRGNPVIIAAALFPALMELRGDTGFRAIAARFRIAELAVDDDGILRDVDTAKDLQ
jgi:molybdenum cofactor cytidylyltransferase